VYPALAVLDRLTAEFLDVQTLWVGSKGGMETDLVTKAGVDFETIPAAGVHGVGLRRLPRNFLEIISGITAARRILNRFKPDVLFFTGGYVAVPMALAGIRIPSVLYVPDIEPGMALKFLANFAEKIALTEETSRKFFSDKKNIVVTGYPVRSDLTSWDKHEAYKFFGFNPELPVLLVTGGSLGSLTINQAVVEILHELLADIQIIHLTGNLTWPQFSSVKDELSPWEAARYRSYPYLHEEMGAAYTIANLVISRAGASSIGEYPHFGIPAILAPYPHAWEYQKVNADYLSQNGAAVILIDSEMPVKLLDLVKSLLRDSEKLHQMQTAMQVLARHDAAKSIANLIFDSDVHKNHIRN
jgi:UDP-N-acetylglucosamine--N-acetylmuramyl-(pentapeptide) pyrophosphoryl-undecaprenol N-acetylglucosamine transferase